MGDNFMGQLTHFETAGFLLALSSMVDDIEIKRFSMPNFKKPEDLFAIYQVSSKDKSLDMTICPSNKKTYEKDFLDNTIKLYNYLNSKNKDGILDIDSKHIENNSMEKNLAMLTNRVITSLHLQGFYRDPKYKDVIAKKFHYFSDMLQTSDPTTDDCYTLLCAGTVMPGLFFGSNLRENDIKDVIKAERDVIKTYWNRIKSGTIDALKNNYGYDDESAKDYFTALMDDPTEDFEK